MIHDDSWWFIMIHGDSLWFLNGHNSLSMVANLEVLPAEARLQAMHQDRGPGDPKGGSYGDPFAKHRLLPAELMSFNGLV